MIRVGNAGSFHFTLPIISELDFFQVMAELDSNNRLTRLVKDLTGLKGRTWTTEDLDNFENVALTL